MMFLTLYWTFLMATATSFTGMSSLPLVRHELVAKQHWITDADLNAALLIGRTTPGPNGIYLVAVGYFAAGYPGAATAALALATPAILIVFLLRALGERTEYANLQSAIRYVILGGAAYSAATLWRMAQSTLFRWEYGVLAAASAAAMWGTKWPTAAILLLAGGIAVAIRP
jgi:chromate transporter